MVLGTDQIGIHFTAAEPMVHSEHPHEGTKGHQSRSSLVDYQVHVRLQTEHQGGTFRQVAVFSLKLKTTMPKKLQVATNDSPLYMHKLL